MAKPIELDIDFEELLPGTDLKIGSAEPIVVRPLTLLQYSTISKKMKALVKVATDEGITAENINSPQSLVALADIIVSDFPEILEEASGISKLSLQKMPLDVLVQILNVVLETNMQSKDSMMGNFKSLAGKVKELLPNLDEGKSEKETKSQKQSNA